MFLVVKYKRKFRELKKNYKSVNVVTNHYMIHTKGGRKKVDMTRSFTGNINFQMYRCKFNGM